MLVIVAIELLGAKWPFSERNLRERLEQASGSRVELGRVRKTFFPHPGCVAEQIRFLLPGSSNPYATVQQLIIVGLYSGLLGREKHVRSVRAEGVGVTVPPERERPQMRDSGNSSLVIDEITAENADVVFPPSADHPDPLGFPVHRLSVTGYRRGQQMRFTCAFRNPKPDGEASLSGTVKPWKSAGEAEFAGDYRLVNADLSTFHGIGGKVSSAGHFQGVLRDLHVRGTTETPDFTVTETQHSVLLRTQFTATVDGTRGIVRLDEVQAQFRRTTLLAHGTVGPQPGREKRAAVVHIASGDARIEDLLYLFVHSEPPLQGATRFQADVELPGEKRRFVERVKMQAEFGIGDSRFTNPETQQKVDELSVRALGDPKRDREDTPVVVSRLRGRVSLQDAIAVFRDISLSVPGASATLRGRYNLETLAVDLHGTMRTDVKLSRATTGLKAFLLKVVEFAKTKKKEGAVVPVKISGSYHKPQFGIDATAEK